MFRFVITILAGAALAFGATGACAQAKKAETKKEQAKKGQGLENAHAMCIGCHGIPGYRTAFPDVYSVPKLGGQQAAYIVKALQAYKSGDRSHPSMRAIVAGLSDQDMADPAAYYGSDAVKAAAK